MKNYEINYEEMTAARARDKQLVELADAVLSLTDTQRELFYTIFDLIYDDPDKIEFAKNWKGKMKDLPAALAQI